MILFVNFTFNESLSMLLYWMERKKGNFSPMWNVSESRDTTPEFEQQVKTKQKEERKR